MDAILPEAIGNDKRGEAATVPIRPVQEDVFPKREDSSLC
jgi:hypothetical protein